LGVILLGVTGEAVEGIGDMVMEAGALVEGTIDSIPSLILSGIEWAADIPLIVRGGDGGCSSIGGSKSAV
jgi:hypothetical protein